MTAFEKSAADQRMIDRSRDDMRRAIWSHLNLLLPYPGVSAAVLDTATEEFIAGGLAAITKRLAEQEPTP